MTADGEGLAWLPCHSVTGILLERGHAQAKHTGLTTFHPSNTRGPHTLLPVTINWMEDASQSPSAHI